MGGLAMRSLWKVFFLGVAVIFWFSSTAFAGEWIILGTRALGMGGAGVAVADDATAPHWNPAALVRRSGLDVQMPIGLNVGAEGGIIKTADEVYDAIKEDGPNGYTLEEALDELGKSNTDYADEATAIAAKSGALGDILVALNSVPNLDKKRQGALGDAYGGFLVRYDNFGFSVAGIGYGAVDPYVNLNVASGWNLLTGAADVEAQFEQLYGTDLDNVGGHTLSTDGAQLASDVADILTTVDATLTGTEATNAANELVYLAEKEGVDVSNPTMQTIIKNIAQGTGEATASAAEADVFEDSAGVVIKALLIYEFRASYARSFWDENVAVGVNLKALEGETRYRKYSMRDLQKGEELIDDITEDKNTKKTTQFDADIGILYRPFKRISVGLMAKHLASPEFEFAPGSDVAPVKLEPQVRLGVALRPFKSLILAADTDLTTNESEILDGYKSRQVGVGAEWTPFGFLALRGGGYKNIESDETGWVYTAGFGL